MNCNNDEGVSLAVLWVSRLPLCRVESCGKGQEVVPASLLLSNRLHNEGNVFFSRLYLPAAYIHAETVVPLHLSSLLISGYHIYRIR